MRLPISGILQDELRVFVAARRPGPPSDKPAHRWQTGQ
jgi:hypothetical protein